MVRLSRDTVNTPFLLLYALLSMVIFRYIGETEGSVILDFTRKVRVGYNAPMRSKENMTESMTSLGSTTKAGSGWVPNGSHDSLFACNANFYLDLSSYCI